MTGNGLPITPTLSCVNLFPFWNSGNHVPLHSPAYIRDILTSARLVEYLEASDCIWRQIYDTESKDRATVEAPSYSCFS